MRLAAPVAHPENPQHDLLKRGYALEEAVLPRLRELGITWLYVHFPDLDDLDRHLSPQLSPARQAVYQQVRDTMVKMQGRTSPGVSFPDYYASTREMITTLMSQGAHPIYMERMSGRLGADAVAHATTVAHLSLTLGLRLEGYLIQQRARLTQRHAREIVNLGVAGMLHDIGKMKLPEPLRSRSEIDGHATDDERLRWEAHPQLGYDMIRAGVECSAAAAVLHHHQRFDGTGFPALPGTEIRPTPPAPSGGDREPATRVASSAAAAAAAAAEADRLDRAQRIHVFARILFVADLYANLVRPPGGGPQRSNLEVLHLIRTGYGTSVDPMIFRALQAVAPPFLPGSTVTLEDRTTAAVMTVRAADPYAPVVRRFKADSSGLEPKWIDLREPGTPALLSAGATPVAPFMPAAAELQCAA